MTMLKILYDCLKRVIIQEAFDYVGYERNSVYQGKPEVKGESRLTKTRYEAMDSIQPQI